MSALVVAWIVAAQTQTDDVEERARRAAIDARIAAATAEEGSVAAQDDRESYDWFLPPRAPFDLQEGFRAHPFIAVTLAGGELGGLLVDAYVTYRFEGLPFAVKAELAPAGIGVSTFSPHFPVAANAVAIYATDFFELGLGGGATIGSDGPCFVDGSGQTSDVCESRLGASFNQHLTIGAHDGLRFVATSSLLVRRNITSTGAEIAFGALRAELNVPIAPTLRVFFGGGGGQPGWALGEIGVHWFVIESGGPGTVVLSLSAGGAGIFDGPYPITQFGGPGGMTGPTAGFGMEWRQ